MELCLQSRDFNKVLLSGLVGRGSEMTVVRKIVAQCLSWMIVHEVKLSPYFMLLKGLAEPKVNLSAFFCETFVQACEPQQLTVDQLLMLMLIARAEL